MPGVRDGSGEKKLEGRPTGGVLVLLKLFSVLTWWQIHKVTHVRKLCRMKYTHIHMNTNKIGEIRIRQAG